MVGIRKIEQLVSRERKIFNFLVFYLLLALFLVVLFINSNGWIFIQTAFIVLLTEVIITGLVSRGKPLHTNEDVSKELSKINEIEEYTGLRDEYMSNKDSTIVIALTVYSLGVIIFLFFRNFNLLYIALSVTGLLILYFSVYLFFRYRINKVTIILLERNKVIKEMKMEKRKNEEEARNKREERRKRMKKRFKGLKRLTKIGKNKKTPKKKKKTKKKSKKKKLKKKRTKNKKKVRKK